MNFLANLGEWKMNINEALRIFNLSGDINPELVKATYRKLCKEYHPDRNPAGLEMMKLINASYDVIKDFNGKHESKSTNDYGAEINSALNVAVKLDGVDVELCGNWVWLSGETKKHKEVLKSAGFRWASKKMQWYFRPDDYKSFSRGKHSMDEIRVKHGSTQFKAKERTRIQRSA